MEHRHHKLIQAPGARYETSRQPRKPKPPGNPPRPGNGERVPVEEPPRPIPPPPPLSARE